MAKMHSRRRGISGSKKPLLDQAPAWVSYKPDEIEALITKLAKQGLSQSQVGLILRDSYGVPDVEKIIGKKLGRVLKEKNMSAEIPEDLHALIKKSLQIKKHLEAHKKDMHSKRGLQLTESKIFRLVKYYKNNGRLPASWKYV
ncbi:MAG: 30S ribosomal protein S15 [DPANN group archaeon]|nr:30S ribosomal protein S15 [DPANN group archaeon]